MTDHMSATESLFIVKGGNEYCFLYSERAPGDMYRALLDCADDEDTRLSAHEALEVIEEMLARALRGL
ncbi:MAG TPA: hypothetical protein DCM87_20940 [Planctomycetes bacterium]|nr:hypothetical protein [Planctomycetota bacterium]